MKGWLLDRPGWFSMVHRFSRLRIALPCILALVLSRPSAALALEWESGPGYRAAEVRPGEGARVGFRRIAALEAGITFTNWLADDRSITNRNLLSGSGVAAGDVDGDGWCDLYFCGLDSANRLYRNLGNWRFEDITAGAGVACPNQDSTGSAFADVDGDGDLDLLVNSLGGGTRLFLNDGRARFTEVTEAAGLAAKTGSTSLALGDIDGDADLDLYVANFRPTTIKDQAQTRFRVTLVDGRPVVTMVNGRPVSHPELANRFVATPSGDILELGEPDALYLNDGKGRFSLVPFTGGSFLDEEGRPLAEPPRDWGLAVQMHDFTGDGAPDIYVCNDLFTPDRIWINDGRGRFRALGRLALRNTSTFSMGVDFGDLDRDGDVDFFVVDMLSRDHQKRHVQASESRSRYPIGLIEHRLQFLRNTLQVNRGDNTFAEIAYFAGVQASEWSWGPIFLDVDLDGYEDILVTNGQWRDFQNRDLAARIDTMRAGKQTSTDEIAAQLRLYPNFATADLLFRNRGDWTFEETGAAWGFNFHGISQGMALADLDNDGDPDVIVNNLRDGPGLYRNETAAPRIAVRLKGNRGNTFGIGARIHLSGGPVPQSQEMIAGGRYMSGDDPMRVFAAGNASPLEIKVQWRSGAVTRLAGAKPNHVYEIGEPSEEVSDRAVRALPAEPIFAEVRLDHRHLEEAFEDFDRQPLLARRLSQLGPGVSWFDCNGDGWDDLVVGTGRGGSPSVFLNDTRGGFVRDTEPILAQPVSRDLTAIIGMKTPGQTILLAGSANYEDGLAVGAPVRQYRLKDGVIDETIPGQAASTGPLALAEVDGDGDLDLFIGGRCLPGRYPEPASSLLLTNDQGKWVPAQRFEGVGLVSGAVFSDLDSDGYPELVLACEWGPIQIWRNEQGRFRDATEELGLEPMRGWWTGIAVGDLDQDGRLDLVAGNWGTNHRWQASSQHSRRIYFGDLDGNGTFDLIESGFDLALAKEVPDRDLRGVAAAFPFITGKIRTFEQYGGSAMAELFGESLNAARRLEVTVLESTLFLNRGGRFEAVRLPAEAQWAPAFGVSVGDLEGDGDEDIFLSQNFFATHPEIPRHDAGRGLWLRGDGQGRFTPVAGQESGVEVYGEQRGCALGDFDADGRVDLAVTQNGNQTKLYRNRAAKPGLRLRLRGPPDNPLGIGAQVRLVQGSKRGPLKEVHAGSGYWSQDSAVLIVARADPAAPARLWVQWPGGKPVAHEIAGGGIEIEVGIDGTIRVLR